MQFKSAFFDSGVCSQLKKYCQKMASNSAIGAAAARIGTRYQSRRQSAVSSANNGSNDVEIGQYLDRANQVEINVSRSETETQAMMSTGVSDKHRNRANKAEESFLDGIYGICKLHDEAFCTIFAYPASNRRQLLSQVTLPGHRNGQKCWL